MHLRFRFGGQPLPEAPSGSDSLFSGRRAHQCRPYVLPRSSPHLRGLRDCFGRGSPVAGPGPPDSCGGAAVSQLQEWILLISQFMSQRYTGQSTLGGLCPLLGLARNRYSANICSLDDIGALKEGSQDNKGSSEGTGLGGGGGGTQETPSTPPGS